MVEIINLGLSDLKKYIADIGEKPFHADQIARWIYNRGVYSFDEMTDLKKSLRIWFSENAHIEKLSSVVAEEDRDSTRMVTELSDKNNVESVIIRKDNRVTLCISSQVGCSFGCSFCLTGKMGFIRNLTVAEMLWQVMGAKELLKEEGRKITNIVFMGMGEPLQNLEALLPALEVLGSPFGFEFGKKKMTISTSGYVPGITQLKESGVGMNLAVSLNAANDTLRSSLMPINKKYPLSVLKESLRGFPSNRGKKLVISYIMLDGINDSIQHARELSKWLTGLAAKINLIPYNGFKSSTFKSSPLKKTVSFQNFLLEKHHVTTIRFSKGEGIGGACGQLIDRLNFPEYISEGE